MSVAGARAQRSELDEEVPSTNRAHYARELLAEILNRAKVVHELALYCLQVGDGAERVERLEGLFRATLLFVGRDCEEARLRGCRGQLFADAGEGWLDAAFIERELKSDDRASAPTHPA